jgi:hypothetical protein
MVQDSVHLQLLTWQWADGDSKENEMFHLLAQTPHPTVEALMASLALIWLGRMLADFLLRGHVRPETAAGGASAAARADRGTAK